MAAVSSMVVEVAAHIVGTSMEIITLLIWMYKQSCTNDIQTVNR